jgi:hypothetical protein
MPQECCGSILSSDPHVNESDLPYMTRNCYGSDEWSLTECSKNCCGSSDATCSPTQEGGHCMRDGVYYKYKGSGSSRERIMMKRGKALLETEYHVKPRKEADLPTTNWYNRARYRDMKRKVIGDIANEKMNLRILQHKDKREQDVAKDLEFDYKKTDTPAFVTVIMSFLALGLFLGLLYILIRYLK